MAISGKKSYKKIFIITLVILSLVISVGFTIYHVNNKLQTNSDKISQLQLELNTTNNNLSNLNQTTRLEINTLYNQIDNLKKSTQVQEVQEIKLQINTLYNQIQTLKQTTQVEQIQEIKLQINTIENKIESLYRAEQRLLTQINNIDQEKEKLKEIVGELYRYNQILDTKVPEEERSRAEEISSTIGDIIKGFIF